VKDDFLSVLSHELRTPLTPILLWARTLQRDPQQPEILLRALRTIERSARAQAELVDELLDVSRIISGKLRLEVRPVEMAELIEAAADAVRPVAEARGITLETTVDPAAGAVDGDPQRLQQVVGNLLGNAVKFTPAGGRIALGLEAREAQVVITVHDSGMG